MSTTDAKTSQWTIARQPITTEPVQNSSPQYYTGSAITANFDNFDSNKMTISGNVATTVGTHTATITPKANYTWASGGGADGTESKTFDWVISEPPYKTMTAIIDLSNSNPATCVTYADDATSMTAKSSAWDTFFGHYPVMLNNGVEGKKLNPNNFAQDVNGNAVDITSGSAGDVMIAFPRRGLKITTSGNKITISMTDNPNDANFKYYAHQRGNIQKEKFYLGAYKGYKDGNSKLRSLSGKTPTANQTIGTFRTQAHNLGSGYENSGFYQLTFRQCMYILKYKNLNSQATVGMGNCNASSLQNTGGTNTKGMDWGESTGKQQMKLFGLEDFNGNIYEWIDGLVTNSNRNMLTATDNFNDSGSCYTNQGQGASSNIENFMSKPQGTTETGFIAKEVSGSSTTYFCDYAALCASCVALFGDSWHAGSSGAYSVVFMLCVYDGASFSHGSIGARLMYL